MRPHDGQAGSNRFGDKSLLMTALRFAGKALPGDYARTFIYLNFIYKPRLAVRRLINAFYRMDHVYAVIGEFKRLYRGPFSILEFGVADGYAFSKKAFATRYLGVEDSVVCHGFDSFEGLPPSDDRRDRGSVSGGDWKAGQYRGRYEELREYLDARYNNCRLHRGMFDACRKYGRDTFLLIHYFTTNAMPAFFGFKRRMDATLDTWPFVPKSLVDRIAQFISSLWPEMLPKKIVEFNRLYEHQLMMKVAGEIMPSGVGHRASASKPHTSPVFRSTSG